MAFLFASIAFDMASVFSFIFIFVFLSNLSGINPSS